MFGNWLNEIEPIVKARIRVGVCALVWAIWNCRNDVVFNKTSVPNFLQVICKVTYWIHICGVSFFVWSSGNIWILDALG
jgi:hypothetical protein